MTVLPRVRIIQTGEIKLHIDFKQHSTTQWDKQYLHKTDLELRKFGYVHL